MIKRCSKRSTLDIRTRNFRDQ